MVKAPFLNLISELCLVATDTYIASNGEMFISPAVKERYTDDL